MATANSNEKIERDIYHKLLDVIPDLMSIEEAGRSKVEGYMDLGFDLLYRTPERLVIVLSHYCRHPSGDMIADPDMEIAVYPVEEIATAISYQDCFGFRAAYGSMAETDQRNQGDMNQFVSQWLSNLIEQGHCIITDQDVEDAIQVENIDHAGVPAQ